ncbi:MAG: hypothetical protein ACRCU0_05280 [Candidatus Rhabdochlamydia sp.]
MTSPTNNQPSQDPRWAQAEAERRTGHKRQSEGRHHIYKAMDAVGDVHGGTVIDETSKAFRKLNKSTKHYSNANRLENDALRARCKEHEIKCTIL